MWKKSPSAWLQQKKIPLNDDDIVNEETEFLAGLIKFDYFSFKKKEYKNQARLEKEETEYLLKTRAPIDFRAGDRVKIYDKWLTVLSVNESLDEKYNAFIGLNPHAIDRFKIKELELK